MLLEVLGTALLHVCRKSLLEKMGNVSNASSLISMGHAHGAPWANYFTFLYRVLLEIAFIMFMELTRPIPLHFFVSSSSTPMGYAAHVSWDNSFELPH